MKVLIDTNVLLDVMLDRADFADASEQAIAMCCSELAEGYITSNHICNLHYQLNHFVHDRAHCKDLVASWVSFLPIADVIAEDCLEALSSQMIDYEDAIVASVAKRMKCDYIVTRNVGDFKLSPVPAIEPKEFVKLAIKY